MTFQNARLYPEAMAVLEQHQQIWPVKIGQLAKDLELDVKLASLPDRVSGSLKKENGRWTIRINRHEHKNRQRFTIAHEIAHYLLHRDQIGNDGITDDTLYRSHTLSDKREAEANRLAADLLMPWSLMRKAVDNDIRSPEKLAKEFEVSEDAMLIRLGMYT